MSNSLTFQFHGICTHFRYGVAAGVPHRVVLPDAAHVAAGLLTVREVTPEPVLYYLTPHFAQLELASGSGDLSVPGLISSGGDLLSGVRLQVLNATEPAMTYRGEHITQLTKFVANYNFASEVVLGGRAACYVDLYGGTVCSEAASEPGRPPSLSITSPPTGRRNCSSLRCSRPPGPEPPTGSS